MGVAKELSRLGSEPESVLVSGKLYRPDTARQQNGNLQRARRRIAPTKNQPGLSRGGLQKISLAVCGTHPLALCRRLLPSRQQRHGLSGLVAGAELRRRRRGRRNEYAGGVECLLLRERNLP